MSNHSPLSNESLSPSTPEAERQSDGQRSRVGRSVKRPIQFLSFWIAIALPFVHLPLLAQGLGSATATLTFLSLLGLNAVALYVGHGHNQE